MAYLTIIKIIISVQKIPALWFILKILIQGCLKSPKVERELQIPLDLPFQIFLFQCFPLVIMMFSTGKGDRQFCQTLFIDKQESRDNGEPFFLHFGLKFMKLPLGEQ